MAFPIRSPGRLLLPILMAGVLVGESGVGPTPMTGEPSAAGITRSGGPARHSPAEPRSPTARETKAQAAVATRRAFGLIREVDAAEHVRPTLGRGPQVRPDLTTTARTRTVVAPRPRPVVAGTGTGRSPTTAAVYRGRNHVWIPSLGINRSVSAFPCSRSRPPDNYVYRWGCSGRNNIYLMGHAHGVFKPLQVAYERGRLKKGMRVVYADGKGRVGTYAVIWWKLTRPTTSASWAWASLSTPSMTLQTCVGSNSEYRLMVRLVATR